ncbi:beta-alanyl-bioamine nonribosomal peptide synthetase ebony-like [Glandiceps talaboti]
MPGIEGVRVHCYEQSSFDRTLVAFYKVCPIEVCTPSLGDMKEDLKKILPSYMIPEMVSVKDWPLLPNGKINNDALRSTFDEHRSSRQNTSTKHTGNDGGDDNASLKPTLSYEQSIIIALISQTLNIPEDLINLESNFFELGGNSVNGVKVVSRLRGMGMHITVDGFFKSTSVHDIASQVSHGTNIELDLTNDSIASEWERRILQDFDIVHFSETTDDNVELALELLTIETTTLSPYNAVMLAKGFSYEDIFLASYQAAKSCVDTPEGPELSFFIKRKCNGEIVGVYANYAASSSLHLTDLMIQVDSLFFQFADNLEEECLQTMDVSYGNNYVYGHLLAVKDGPMPLKLDLVRLMEKYLCDYARKSGFKSIWTFNDHPLTQVVSRETGYVVHGRKRFRDFCHDGQRVFENIQPSYLELEFATKDL